MTERLVNLVARGLAGFLQIKSGGNTGVRTLSDDLQSTFDLRQWFLEQDEQQAQAINVVTNAFAYNVMVTVPTREVWWVKDVFIVGNAGTIPAASTQWLWRVAYIPRGLGAPLTGLFQVAPVGNWVREDAPATSLPYCSARLDMLLGPNSTIGLFQDRVGAAAFINSDCTVLYTRLPL